jgi:hypothetical protein
MLSRTLETTLESAPKVESVSSLYNLGEEPITDEDRSPNWAGMAVAGALFLIIGVAMLSTSSGFGGGVIFVGILMLIGARVARGWEKDDVVFSDLDYDWEKEMQSYSMDEHLAYRNEERQKEIEEIVKAVKATIRVRCKYCGTLNEEKSNKCESCGGSM